jgi:hypothetical protein
MSDSITLTETEIEFLKFKFDTEDPDQAVEMLVEFLVREGVNPLSMKDHIERLMKRYQC